MADDDTSISAFETIKQSMRMVANGGAPAN